MAAGGDLKNGKIVHDEKNDTKWLIVKDDWLGLMF